MSVTSRLQRVTRSLSPLQRAVLILQAMREGREPDPDLRAFDDEQHRRAFIRYMGLLWVINQQLGAIANVIANRAEMVENARFHFDLLNEAAGLMEEQEGTKPARPVRNWRESRGTITVQTFLRSLAQDSKEEGAALLTQLWQELNCLESVWADLGGEFGGEDVVLREYREIATETRGRMQEAARTLGVRKLPDHGNEAIEQTFHSLVNDAFKNLGLVEVYA